MSNLDPRTGLPWGETEDGVNHTEDHAPVDSCPFDSCSACGGYHCGLYCPEVGG